MPDTDPRTSPEDRLRFLDSHRPTLLAGEYEFVLGQEVHPPGDAGAFPTTFEARRQVSVRGGRTVLPPGEVVAVYPPADAVGTFDGVLPHVVLRRSTLPWERSACSGVSPDRRPPWLALLVFRADEAPEVRTVRRDAVPLAREQGEHDGDPVQVIAVEASRARALLPADLDALLLGAHARQVRSAESGATVERALVVGARLPTPGQRHVVHLVSLEERYVSDDGETCRLPPPGAPLTLVTLLSWSFTCGAAEHSLRERLAGLNADRPGRAVRWRLPLPPAGEGGADAARARLEAGFVPLRATLRSGRRTVAWYRSPFVPVAQPAPELPAVRADAFAVMDRELGMLDLTWAAAWQLGRALALAEPGFAATRYAWKRVRARALARGAKKGRLGCAVPRLHAPPAGTSVEEALAMPDEVRAFLPSLARLERVPASYLVPAADLLPPESLRLAVIDPGWIRCLLDGALSIGRNTTTELTADQGIALPVPGPRTALLLRSSVVVDYPELDIDAWGPAAPGAAEDLDLPHLDAAVRPFRRMARRVALAPDLLLCVFEGRVDLVDLHTRPEALHFGLDPDEDGLGRTLYTKQLAPSAPGEAAAVIESVRISPDRVVDLPALAAAIATARGVGEAERAARFALDLLQAPDLVRFVRAADDLSFGCAA